MKKILIITLLLLSVNITAQDLNFITSLNNTTAKEALVLSDSIVAVSLVKYKLLKTSIRGTRQRFIYIPKNVTEDDFKTNMRYEIAFVIDFAVFEKEPGIKTLKLTRIKAPYEVVFNVWKSKFKPEANLISTPTNYSSQKYNTENLTFIFSKDVGFGGNVWTISNQS